MHFEPLTFHLLAACERFTQRLRGAQIEPNFRCIPNRERDSSPPKTMEVERFAAVDADGEVRGLYLLRWQYLWLRGEQLLGSPYGHPISEGCIDKKYTMLGVSILRDATKRCEYLYVLGGGDPHGNLFNMARHAGWKSHDVPLLFRVIRGGAFVRKLRPTQRRPLYRGAAAIAEATGLSQHATGILHAASAMSYAGNSSLRLAKDVAVDEVSTLAPIADDLWLRVRNQYDFCVVRDGAHVGSAFPGERTDLHRLVVRYQGAVVGWAVVVIEESGRQSAFLGNVVPGVVVDVFGDTNHAEKIVRAVTSHLAGLGAEVIICNSCHALWLTAYKKNAFLSWRSQFPLFVSKALAGRIGDLPNIIARTHMSRGDSDSVNYSISSE